MPPRVRSIVPSIPAVLHRNRRRQRLASVTVRRLRPVRVAVRERHGPGACFHASTIGVPRPRYRGRRGTRQGSRSPRSKSPDNEAYRSGESDDGRRVTRVRGVVRVTREKLPPVRGLLWGQVPGGAAARAGSSGPVHRSAPASPAVRPATGGVRVVRHRRGWLFPATGVHLRRPRVRGPPLSRQLRPSGRCQPGRVGRSNGRRAAVTDSGGFAAQIAAQFSMPAGRPPLISRCRRTPPSGSNHRPSGRAPPSRPFQPDTKRLRPGRCCLTLGSGITGNI